MNPERLQHKIDTIVLALRRQGPVVLLESQKRDDLRNPKTYIAGIPDTEITAKENTITLRRKKKIEKRQGNIWNLLGNILQKQPDWYLGYLSYDLKNEIEDLTSKNRDPVDAPDLWLMVPELLVEIDYSTQKINCLKGDLESLIAREVTEETSKQRPLKLGPLEYSVTKEQYQKTICRAKALIHQGDLYEINLAHQSRARYTGDPYQLYQAMRKKGPVPFGAYLQTDHVDVCSASPERFIAKKGNGIWSQPIKGTIQRGSTRQEDEEMKQKLAESAKNRAENLMIVDLVRHDFNKIAVKGTVAADHLFRIQTFETVHQMVSTIRAKTEVRNPADILKACFPMGSMTGAPKIRAMQRIEELEQFKRGIYSGCIGYITPEYDFDFNVVIRTAILKQDYLYYAAGGAITGDSDEEEEWYETLLKKQALTNILKNSN